MAQSNKMSIIETAANVTTGFITSLCITIYVMPFWGYEYSVQESFQITSTFMIISFIRLYIIRRIFSRISN